MIRAFQSNPSLARSACIAAICGTLPGVAAGRRSVALTRTSSIARAGEIGETDPCDVHQPAHRPPMAQTSSRSRATRTTQAPSLGLRRPITGHSPIRAFFAWRSATRSSFARPGRTTQVLPFFVSRRPTALLGFDPFAGLLPQAGGRATQAWRLNEPQLSLLCCIEVLLLAQHFCWSGPTCRSCLSIRPD